MEKYWKKYIEIPVIKEIKIEDEDDESITFETVEMIIEPVEPMTSSSSGFDGDVDYLDGEEKPDFEAKYESFSYDDGSIDISDLDDTQDSDTRDVKLYSMTNKRSCQDCDVTGLTTVQLRMHQQSCHPESLGATQFVCDVCQKTYSSRYGIRTHMKRHMQTGSAETERPKRIKRYQCSSCDERFSKKTLLVEHELRHSGVSAINIYIILPQLLGNKQFSN